MASEERVPLSIGHIENTIDHIYNVVPEPSGELGLYGTPFCDYCNLIGIFMDFGFGE